MSPFRSEERIDFSWLSAECVEADDFLTLLDEKLRLRNERLKRRLLAWGKLLDIAGWCVALDLSGEVRPWLSNLAIRDLQERGDLPDNWNAVLASISRLSEGSLHRRSEGVLIWSGRDSIPSLLQPTTGLTRREAEIMAWLREGKTSPEIAIILGCAVRTVEKHLGNLYRKLGVSNRHEVILETSKS